jgi:hypothetical protein
LAFVSGCVSEDDPPGGTGGGGGSSGATASGGAGGGSSTGGASGGDPLAIACPTPTMALITDFTTANADGKGASFGDFTMTFSGYTYQYPAGLVADTTKGGWHVTGMVDNYAGLGIGLKNVQDDCTKFDARAFKGISFTISGTIPGGEAQNRIFVWISTASNDVASSWKNAHKAMPTDPDVHNFGRCIPPGDNQYDGTCQNAEKAYDVTETPSTISVRWEDMMGLGKPITKLEPIELVSFGFRLPSPAGVGTASVTPYALDITIDDIKFIE